MGQRCQSCGMPLNKDPQGGGSESDGSRSTRYCSLCYDNGTFRQNGVSVDEFQAQCLEALARKGMPRVMAWAFTRGIPKLDRWTGSRNPHGPLFQRPLHNLATIFDRRRWVKNHHRTFG